MDGTRRRLQIAVVGPRDADEHLAALAAEAGRLLAEHGAVLVTGGLGGVMAAACRGAGDGLTIGFLPGAERSDANPWVDVVVPTGLGEARDALVVAAADGVLAVGGSWGTLAEVALAVRSGRPVVQVGGWTVHDAAGAAVPGVTTAATPAEAVEQLIAALARDRHHT